MDSIITIGSVALTGLVTQLITVYRERRNRRWDMEDRKSKAELVAEELRKQSEKVSAALIEHNEKIDTTSTEQTGQVLDALQVNTDISKQAFSEANGLNGKIAGLNEKIAKLNELVVIELGAMGRRLDQFAEQIKHLPCEPGPPSKE